MAVDMTARLLALSKGGGVSPSDTYTRQEIEEMLEGKADKAEVTALETVQSAQDDAISAVAEQAALNMKRKNLLRNSMNSRQAGSITFTVDKNNGSILVTGTTISVVAPVLFSFTVDRSGEYILSGCPSGGGTGAESGYLATIRPSTDQNKILAIDSGSGCKIMLESGMTYNYSISIYGSFVPEKHFIPCSATPKSQTTPTSRMWMICRRRSTS